MTNTSWLNFQFPVLILFTISFWSIFFSHILISGGIGYTCKMILVWNKNKKIATKNLGLTTANYQRKGHTPPHSTTSCQENQRFLPAYVTGWHITRTHFWRVGGSEERTAGVEGKVGWILDRRTIVQEGQESNCWPNMEYALAGTELVAESRINSSGKLIFTFSCIIQL